MPWVGVIGWRHNMYHQIKCSSILMRKKINHKIDFCMCAGVCGSLCENTAKLCNSLQNICWQCGGGIERERDWEMKRRWRPRLEKHKRWVKIDNEKICLSLSLSESLKDYDYLEWNACTVVTVNEKKWMYVI